MHILYLHQHFAIPSGSTGTRSYEFAKRWVLAGHRVTVICGHYDIGGLEYTNHPQDIDGIKVIIVGTKYSNKMGFFKRVFSFISFMFSAFLAGLRQENIDIIYATSTPLTIGIPAIFLKIFKRKPFVFEVRDQWPEVPIELGVIKNPILIKSLLLLEKIIYKFSDAIVALSPGMAAGVKKIIGIQKPISIVPNCSDLEIFRPDIDGTKIREKFGWKNKFLLVHFGAIGKANGLNFLLKVAEKLQTVNDIHFVIIGDGSEKQRLISTAEDLKLVNVEFLGGIPKKNLPMYVAAADVCLVVFANYPILEHNSANKFFDSLAAGKPILLNNSGWQRDIVESNNAGLGCRLCDADEFVKNILYLKEHSEELQIMGRNARRIAEEKFDRSKLAQDVLVVLEKYVGF